MSGPKSMGTGGKLCSLTRGVTSLWLLVIGFGACAGPSPGTMARAAGPAAIVQTGFRVRSDAAAELNADRGWAGGLNESVTVYADQPFRLRFELEGAAGATGDRRFRLQYRRNGGDWIDIAADGFPKPEEASPRVTIISSAAYQNGAATADLLDGSPAPFRPAAGLSLADTTPAWSGAGAQGEWEWPLVIRRFADGAVTNDEGDRFEFRMVEEKGEPVASRVDAALTLSVPHGHVGGTFVETPGRIGPWQSSNGDLYFIMEPTETDNVLMMVKSSDGGATWREVDGANRPLADDLEGVASELVGSTIHILHQTSENVWHHAFRTSDHPTHPDTWIIRDELAATMGEPPTQTVSVAVRSDGSIVGIYGGPEKVHLKIRSPEGTWGEERVIDSDVASNLSGPQAVTGAGDVVHLAYTGADGTAWYRRLQPDGTLTPRVGLATGLGTTDVERIAILPLVFIPDTNTLVVVYRLSTGRLWARRIVDHGTPTPAVMVSDRDVVTSAVDSHQAGADAIADGTTVHVLFIERSTGSIYHTQSDQAGVWRPSRLQVDGIRGSWIRGTPHAGPAGSRVYGYIYDAGSEGGSGMNEYATVGI